MNTNYSNKAVRVTASVAFAGIALWLIISSFQNEPDFSPVDVNPLIPIGEQDAQNDPSRNDFENYSNGNSAVTSRILQSQEPERHASYIATLNEIAARISEGQFEEGENELRALQQLIDVLSDAEKYAFLEFFIDYSQTHVFNPEVITAFDVLWSNLELDDRTKRLSTQRLASHYANSYEFVLAMNQFDILSQLGVNFDAGLHRDVAYAQFGLGEYLAAVPNLIKHIELQTGQGNSVDRREYSMLFESYYRTGNPERAEQIGMLLLEHYNDIQDWKDMRQFYQTTGNAAGLKSLLSRARRSGLLNQNGEWLD